MISNLLYSATNIESVVLWVFFYQFQWEMLPSPPIYEARLDDWVSLHCDCFQHSNSLADLRGEMNGILFLFLPIESPGWPDIKTWCRAPLKILHFSYIYRGVCGSLGPGWNWGGHLKDPRIRSSDFHHWQRLCETHNDILITILTWSQIRPASELHPPQSSNTSLQDTSVLYSVLWGHIYFRGKSAQDSMLSKYY